MKKNTKHLLLAASCLCGAVLVGSAFGVVTAKNVTAEDIGITMLPGASIRMDVTKDDNQAVTGYDTGIRFTATVAPTLAETLVEDGAYVDGAEVGMFIVPQQYIDAFEASEYTDYFAYFSEVKGKAKADIAYVCDAADLNLTKETSVNVSILKLLEKNYNLSYQGVAYYAQTVGDKVTYKYTSPSEARTVSFVANAALLDTETTYSEDQRTALSNIIEKAVQLKSNFAVTVNAGEWLDLQQEFVSEITAEDLAFTIKEGDCITLKGGFMDTEVTDAGEATVNVTAYGGLVDFDIAVTVKAREIADNEVVDFKLASDLQYADDKGESTLEYVESFNGAQGVLKATAANWSHVGFKSLKPISEYSGKYLVIRMWVETTATDGFVYIKDSSVGKSLTAIQTGRWVNYYFDGAIFLEQWTDQGSYYSSMATNRAGTYYIDKIYMTDDMEVIDFGAATDVAYTVNREGVEGITYIESFEGAQGVVKVEDTDGWAAFGFKTVMPIANYAEFDYLVIRMYATGESTLKIANPYSFSFNTVRTNEWVEYYFDGSAFLTQWADQGNYYSSLFFGKAGLYYIDEIYMSNSIPTIENGALVDFAVADDVSLITVTNGTASWVNTDGTQEGGYLKVDYTAQPSFSLDISDCGLNWTDYKWLVLRVNFKGGDAQVQDVNMNGLNEKLGWIYNGKYVNYVFDISTLTTSVVNFTTSVKAEGNGTFYVDEIYLLKDVSEADLSIVTEGTLTAGETVSVSLVNPSNASYLSMTVTAPDGSAVSAEGFTAVAGTYTVTVQLATGSYYDSTNYVDELRNICYYSGGATTLTFTFMVV